jgi:hypothetical protein
MSGYDSAIQATQSRIKWLNISIDNSLLYGLDDDCPQATVKHVVSGVTAMQAELRKLESELKLMRALRK